MMVQKAAESRRSIESFIDVSVPPEHETLESSKCEHLSEHVMLKSDG